VREVGSIFEYGSAAAVKLSASNSLPDYVKRCYLSVEAMLTKTK
jgi:hypothetical protein